MEQQIVNAVAAALDPASSSELRLQAMQFCQQTSPEKEGPQARLFALQTIEEALAKRSGELNTDSILYIKRGFMDYLTREFARGDGESTAAFLRNRVARTLTLLLKISYTSHWPTFFQDLFALVAIKPSLGPANGPNNAQYRFNPLMSDVVLRILHEVTVDLADMNLQRTREQQIQDSIIKDAIRANDMNRIIEFTFELAQDSAGRIGQDATQAPDIEVTPERLLEKSVRVLGEWASWVEISLILTQPFISLLYSTLGLSMPLLRLAAIATLTEIIGKGMPSADKLRMLDLLNVLGMLGSLELGSPQDADSVHEDEQHFREHVARLVNTFGLELTRVIDESSNPPELKDRSYDLIVETFPYILRFIADTYDDTASAVFPYVREILSIYKQMRKKMPRAILPKQRIDFLTSLLDLVLLKMRYDEDFDWVDDDDTDEGLMFAEIRKELRLIYDAIAAIDEDLFNDTVQKTAIATLQKFKMNDTSISWQELEGLLYVIYLYGETFKGTPTFTTSPYPIPRKPGGAAPEQPDPKLLQLNTLGQLMEHLVQSNISDFPHPAVPLQFFEVLVRYSFFFEVRDRYLVNALQQFIDHRGLHSPNDRVRTRAWYLFYRFVRQHRAKMRPYSDQILGSIGDVLAVRAVPPEEYENENKLSELKSYEDTTFDAQLYLFETVGILLSLDGIGIDKQNQYLQAVLDPISSQLQTSIGSHAEIADALSIISLHHHIMAIGSIAKGLPDAPRGHSPTLPPSFSTALDAVIAALGLPISSPLVRDAARFTFTRLIATYTSSIFALIPQLVARLLQNVQTSEVIDLCPFLGLIFHRYKSNCIEPLNGVLGSFLDLIFSMMARPVNGTDEALQLLTLKKAYLGLIHQIFACEIARILLTESNKGRLDSVISSVLHFASQQDDLNVQKQALTLLQRMFMAWGGADTPTTGKSTDQGGPLAGFDQFARERVVPLCFQIPGSATFDLKDAQSQLVLAEIAAVQKSLWQIQGDALILYLRDVYFKSINCPSSLVDEYITNLQSADIKGFRKYFQNFMSQSRGLQ